jgi:hypothetical protein
MELEEEDEDLSESQKKLSKNKKSIKDKKSAKKILKKKRKIKIIRDSESENNSEETKSANNEINTNDNTQSKNKQLPITKLSSLDPNLFSDEYIADYKCILCGLIPSYETAEESTCCGYLFCQKCKIIWLLKKKKCPKCSIPSSEIIFRNIKNNNKIFYKSLKNFIIKCPYNCEWKGPWNELDSHILKCDLSFRYCSYKCIGCEIFDENKKVKEHEELNNKLHLDLALKFIEDKNIKKNKIKFELGQRCMTNCHAHPLTYCINLQSSWICDGDNLELGCDKYSSVLSKEMPRYRCNICNFDLCDTCIEKYFMNYL